jgi:hypothetical protein
MLTLIVALLIVLAGGAAAGGHAATGFGGGPLGWSATRAGYAGVKFSLQSCLSTRNRA